MALAVILAAATRHTLATERDTLLQESECLHCSLSDKQMFMAAVWLQNHAYNQSESPANLMKDITCLKCADPRQIRALVLRLWCELLST